MSLRTRYTVHGRGAKLKKVMVPLQCHVDVYTSHHPMQLTVWTRVLPSSKGTLRNVSRTSQRQFEIPVRKSQSAGTESVPNHDHHFLTCCQKVPKWGSEKGSLNRPIPALKLFERCSLLDPSKSSAQNTTVQEQWSTLHILLAKINYSPEHAQTDNRFSGTHGRKERFAQ